MAMVRLPTRNAKWIADTGSGRYTLTHWPLEGRWTVVHSDRGVPSRELYSGPSEGDAKAAAEHWYAGYGMVPTASLT